MNRRSLLALAGLVLATGAFVTPNIPKWPPWLSIESPVNPYDDSARGALLLVHARFREGPSQVSDLTGTAEGIVNGARRTVALGFENTSRPDVYALKPQWQAEGRWVLRINLKTTTALVAIGADGKVGTVEVPMTTTSTGDRVPRAVTNKDVDSLLSATSKR